MEKAEAFVSGKWMEVYPEYWIMSNSTDLSSYLYHTPLNKVQLRCSECKEDVFICSLGDGMKKKPYFAHRQCKEKDEDASDCNLRTSSELYKEIYKFEKPRAGTYESVLHTEMKRFAVSKFWSKENKYVVIKEEDIFTFNRDDKTKLRADLLAGPLYSKNDKPIQRSEQYIFEGQTTKNPLSINHIEKAIEYKKIGFSEENIINAYSIDHLKRATFISNNFIDILKLQSLNRTEIDEEISNNKSKRGSIINMLEHTTVDKISGYYAFHADTEFLLALKEYSNNHLLFMYIPITEGLNQLEERNKHKRRLILASVLDTITIKEDYCVVAYLYFKDVTYITDITEYQHEVAMYKNKTIEFCQNSLRELGLRYTKDIDEKDNKILNLSMENERLQGSIREIQFEFEKRIAEKENEIALLKHENKQLNTVVAKTKEELSSEIETKVRKEIESECIRLEKLRNDYTATYEDVAVVAEKSVVERLEKEYKDKYSALTDGHSNARKRTWCTIEQLKAVYTVRLDGRIEINSKIRCPFVSNSSDEEYMNEYLKIQKYTCQRCTKYK